MPVVDPPCLLLTISFALGQMDSLPPQLICSISHSSLDVHWIYKCGILIEKKCRFIMPLAGSIYSKALTFGRRQPLHQVT